MGCGVNSLTENIYGLTVLNPAMHVQIVMPKLTWREAIHCALLEAWYVISQCLLLAGSITAFQIAFGFL